MPSERSYFARNRPWVLVSLLGVALLLLTPLSKAVHHRIDEPLSSIVFYTAVALIVLGAAIRAMKNRVLSP